MSVVTGDDVRGVTGYTSDEADDTALQPYIDKAYRRFINDVTYTIWDDRCTGAIDGENTTFRLNHYPVADRNFDGVADSLDITVSTWVSYGSISTMQTIPASSLNPDYGYVVLSSAPESTIGFVTATYKVYPRVVPNDILVDAVANLAGYLFVLQEHLLIPERMSHGSYRWTLVRPYAVLYDEYMRYRDMITANIGEVLDSQDLGNIRKEIS